MQKQPYFFVFFTGGLRGRDEPERVKARQGGCNKNKNKKNPRWGVRNECTLGFDPRLRRRRRRRRRSALLILPRRRLRLSRSRRRRPVRRGWLYLIPEAFIFLYLNFFEAFIHTRTEYGGMHHSHTYRIRWYAPFTHVQNMVVCTIHTPFTYEPPSLVNIESPLTMRFISLCRCLIIEYPVHCRNVRPSFIYLGCNPADWIDM